MLIKETWALGSQKLDCNVWGENCHVLGLHLYFSKKKKSIPPFNFIFLIWHNLRRWCLTASGQTRRVGFVSEGYGRIYEESLGPELREEPHIFVSVRHRVHRSESFQGFLRRVNIVGVGVSELTCTGRPHVHSRGIT